MNIIRHPADWTPEGLLKESLRESDQIESVVVLVKYKDGTYGRVWSKQSVEDLMFKRELLSLSISRMLEDGQC
jgi:hypothetical protein